MAMTQFLSYLDTYIDRHQCETQVCGHYKMARVIGLVSC